MQPAADKRLLMALAEQLKLPLLQIARSAELAHETGNTDVLTSISYIADTALGMLDGFLLSAAGQESLHLEPVSVASVLNETAHKLSPLAKQNNCDIELSLHGRYEPVMAHRPSLEAALMLLGYSMVEARMPDSKRHQVVFGAHKSSNGLVTGIFDNQKGLSSDMFRRGRALYGSARQTMPGHTATNGASIFVADVLFAQMQSPLHVARHNSLTGLAATLHPSQQVRLV